MEVSILVLVDLVLEAYDCEVILSELPFVSILVLVDLVLEEA